MAHVIPPLPGPSHDDAPYWEGLRRHELIIQECISCKEIQHPPKPSCGHCGSLEVGWRKGSGKGTVYSYTVVPQATHAAWRDQVPYNVVIVELEEDVRLISNLIGVDNEDIKIGSPVEIVYDDITEEITLPRFRVIA